MATIEKTSANNWRITKMYKGKRYRLNVEHKPTKTEAERLIWALIEAAPKEITKQSFEKLANDYIDKKSITLSPASIRSYAGVLRRIPANIKKQSIKVLSEDDIQTFINQYSIDHKYNSSRSIIVFINTILVYAGASKMNIKIPNQEESEFYVPEDSDIDRILDHVRGTRWEMIIRLGIYGIRRGEICALNKSDLSEDNILTVNKSKVQGKDKKWYIKVPKTKRSIRKFKIADDLAEIIRNNETEHLVELNPGGITRQLRRFQKRLGIELFAFHKLRHYFAATAREVMGDAYVEKMGGWAPGSNIMKKVYDYAKAEKEKQAQEAFIKRIS